MGFQVDAAGQRFGRLKVVKFSHNDARRKTFWECRCDCGNKVVTTRWHMTSGNTLSCGCLQKDKATESCKKRSTHGDAPRGRKGKVYYVWANMRRRCECKSATFYKHYGGRGIKVCKRWKSYINFKSDMGPRPTDEYTLERVNNNKGYCPSNCVWIHYKLQPRNQRTNRVITYKGRKQCLAAWAEELGLTGATISKRLKRGWSLQKTLSTPNLRH